MIKLVNISLKYVDRMILDIPELIFVDGKRYCLIGENGSGKTTLLRIMAGTLKPDKGEVINDACEDMGYMPQSPYAFSFSVHKNVEIALKGDPQAEQIAMDALKKVGMDGFAHSRGHKLSGGETQRMALARMIAKSRKLLLLDEPTSSTDIRGMDLIEKTLLQYSSDTGCTLIFSTHSPAQALRMAEQVIFLHQGKIVEQGLAQQVLTNPRSEIARQFFQHWQI
jgi:tungstate transport system ATP-binding protein